jgi:MFS family permease
MAFLLALSVGLVLSDSSVVTLALPAILREFDTSVPAVAWVLISFNLALATAAVAGARLVRAGRARVAFAAGIVAFAVASLACAAAPSLGMLVAARAAQGVVGAIVVAAALELLLRRTRRDRAVALWAAAGVLGGAVGPALGGYLTQAFSWEAMFALQAPVALVGLVGMRGASASPAPASMTARPPVRAAPLVALALVSAALAAALFLLVVLLIEGWRRSPGQAALVVTVMPLAALVAGRWAREHHGLAPGSSAKVALPGAVLLAGGLAALGLLPGSGAAWTIAPQLAIGSGLGLALGALVGGMLGDGDGDGDGDVTRPAAWTIAARHAGIVAGLLVLTPIFAADLDAVVDPAQRAGLALVLDAPLELDAKIALARALDAELRGTADQELPDLDAAFARVRFAARDRGAVAQLRDDLDDELDRAATAAFSRSFLAAALLALLAAAAAAVALALARSRPPPAEPATNGNRLEPPPSLNVAVPAAATIATLLVAAYVALGGASYGPTQIADPCAPRGRPQGVGKTQLTLLAAVDGAACDLRLTREDMLLTLLDRRRPPGVSEDELGDALRSGVDRAQREGALGGLAATALRFALRIGGAKLLIDRLLG